MSTHFVALADPYRKRKCADTIGTVPVPMCWPFPMLKCKYIFEIKYRAAIIKQHSENWYGLKSTECWSQFKKIILLCYFIIFFGTLSFTIQAMHWSFANTQQMTCDVSCALNADSDRYADPLISCTDYMRWDQPDKAYHTEAVVSPSPEYCSS